MSMMLNITERNWKEDIMKEKEKRRVRYYLKMDILELILIR